jgi:UDP-4-amino-4,6-dideoxy-N-acetyl-beta-L-altrosamine transaminase
MKNIPYGRQDIDSQDIEAVRAVLQSDWLTQGPAIERFESSVAQYCGVKYAVAVSNATAALHIAALAAGLSKGDRLWTSPNTFVASANCGLYCGAEVDFIDINPSTYNLCSQKLEAALEKAARAGKLPKVVVPVHFAGQSCRMDQIAALSSHYGFSVIEDASHAIGGSFLGRKIGACQFSDMAVFSFHPVKIITTGEGGMVLTNRKDLYEKLLRLRTHGITRDPSQMTQASEGAWYYEQIDLGFNYRMTDIQAALGWSQLRKIDEFAKRRRELVARYDSLLADLPVTLPKQDSDCESVFHLYVVRVNQRIRARVFHDLREQGIGVNVHYIPVHLQPYYRHLGFKLGDCPESEKYYEECITLPLFPGLAYEDQDRVVAALRAALSK